jgi:hypothetical protein
MSICLPNSLSPSRVPPRLLRRGRLLDRDGGRRGVVDVLDAARHLAGVAGAGPVRRPDRRRERRRGAAVVAEQAARVAVRLVVGRRAGEAGRDEVRAARGLDACGHAVGHPLRRALGRAVEEGRHLGVLLLRQAGHVFRVVGRQARHLLGARHCLAQAVVVELVDGDRAALLAEAGAHGQRRAGRRAAGRRRVAGEAQVGDRAARYGHLGLVRLRVRQDLLDQLLGSFSREHGFLLRPCAWC